MHPDITHGNILVISDDRKAGERLNGWIAALGERPVLLLGAEKYLIEEGDDEMVDLVVINLNTEDPAARQVLGRLLSGDLFESVPQIHLLRDPGLRSGMVARSPRALWTFMPSPPPEAEFQERVRLSSEVGRLRRELHRISIREPMTGLLNRRYLLHRLEEEFARARRYRTPISLVFFDIDHLKKINDSFGQEIGDSVILQVAEVLRSRVRREDILGRTGEESFGVVLPNNRYRGAAVFASNLRTEVEEKLLPHGGDDVPIRISAGISCFPDNNAVHCADDLIRAAENALDEAKKRGGNRVFIDEAVLKGEKRLILVVDPDRRLLELAEDLLSMDDYRVVLSDTSRTAMETLRFRRPDLLVLDLHMSDLQQEEPLLEQIHAMFPGERFPILGLSRAPEGDPEQLSRLGVDRFITKPFSLSLLRSVVRELLDTYKPLTL